MTPDIFIQWAVLLLAAFGAGVLNAVAGGGSFLTLPALIWAGVPPVTAGATSAVVVAPGYLGGVLGYRQELAHIPPRTLGTDSVVCAAGGVIGALLLLWTQDQIFAALVPWLLLFATALFMVGPALNRWLGQRRGQSQQHQLAHHPVSAVRIGLLLLVAIYGGYFNGGLGVMLMAMYFLVGETHLHTVNALKNLDSLILAIVSVAAFVVAGAVMWRYALPMMLAAAAGGFAGARLARQLPLVLVRYVVIATGIGMALLLFLKK